MLLQISCKLPSANLVRSEVARDLRNKYWQIADDNRPIFIEYWRILSDVWPTWPKACQLRPRLVELGAKFAQACPHSGQHRPELVELGPRSPELAKTGMMPAEIGQTKAKLATSWANLVRSGRSSAASRIPDCSTTLGPCWVAPNSREGNFQGKSRKQGPLLDVCVSALRKEC